MFLQVTSNAGILNVGPCYGHIVQLRHKSSTPLNTVIMFVPQQEVSPVKLKIKLRVTDNVVTIKGTKCNRVNSLFNGTIF